ncbi:MAG: C_GCAxxG_C_C family protein [Paludibacteraceae bacterium]|nr:C_GCAxxG_C_C family protein [Paludibacteraceae bacterium]
MILTQEDIEKRVSQARSLHRAGFNCSQAVFAACADLYHIPQDQALRLSASFGGGIGGTRSVCGAVCAMCMVEGLRSGSATPGDLDGKKANYARVQQLLEQFKRQHGGSVICAELLQNPANPSCNDKVANAARIALQSVRTAPLPEN